MMGAACAPCIALCTPNSCCKLFHAISSEKIFIRVIDPFTIKPLDKKTILENARATKGRIITVEDHYHEGELGPWLFPGGWKLTAPPELREKSGT